MDPIYLILLAVVIAGVVSLYIFLMVLSFVTIGSFNICAEATIMLSCISSFEEKSTTPSTMPMSKETIINLISLFNAPNIEEKSLLSFLSFAKSHNNA